MEWADRIGLTFWVVVLGVVLVVFAVIGWRLVRMAAAARRGDFTTGPARGRTAGPRSTRSPSARGSSRRPGTADRVYLLDDSPDGSPAPKATAPARPEVVDDTPDAPPAPKATAPARPDVVKDSATTPPPTEDPRPSRSDAPDR
jgi:hypothetical protein